MLVHEDTFPTTSIIHVISAGFKILFLPKRSQRTLRFTEIYSHGDEIFNVRFNNNDDQFLVASVFAKGNLFRELEKGKDMRICVDPMTYKLLSAKKNEKFVLILLHTIIDVIHGMILTSSQCNSLGLAWLRFHLEHLNSYGFSIVLYFIF